MDHRAPRVLHRSGFTLLELVLSLSVSSILLMAVGSAIMMAAKAVPDPDTPDNETALPARVVADISAELQLAVSFIFRDSDTVEFTVADRSGDKIAETIRYDWSGTAGDPLTRQYNGGPVTNVIAAVKEVGFLYVTSIVNEQETQESAEVLLDGLVSPLENKAYTIVPSFWVGQYIQPSLPAGALSWTVTRVELQMQMQDSPSTEHAVWVQLRTAYPAYPGDPAGLPTPLVLEQYYADAQYYADEMDSSMSWKRFDFDDIPPLPADEGLCLVVKWAAGDDGANVRYTTTAGNRIKTGDAGALWQLAVDKSLLYKVYGTYKQNVTVATTYLTGIRIRIRTGSDPTTRVETTAPLLHIQDITP